MKLSSLLAVLFVTVSGFAQNNMCVDFSRAQLPSESVTNLARLCQADPPSVKCAVSLAKQYPAYITLENALKVCKSASRPTIECAIDLGQRFPGHVPLDLALKTCTTYTKEVINCAVKLAKEYPGYVALDKALYSCQNLR